MEPLENVILRLEPRIDLIHECCGIGRFAELTCTSDSFFLGRARGDCGFNFFLGQPSPEALRRTKALFERLSGEHQSEVLKRLRERHIHLAAVGLAGQERLKNKRRSQEIGGKCGPLHGFDS